MKVTYIPGKPAILTIYADDSKKVTLETIELNPINDKKRLHELLYNKGFRLRTNLNYDTDIKDEASRTLLMLRENPQVDGQKQRQVTSISNNMQAVMDNISNSYNMNALLLPNQTNEQIIYIIGVLLFISFYVLLRCCRRNRSGSNRAATSSSTTTISKSKISTQRTISNRRAAANNMV